MSRQRIRTGVLESSTEKCPYCGGTGHMRSVSSVALQLLRSLEEMLIKGATHNIIVRTRAEVAIYVLNHKRAHLRELEQRFQITIMVNSDPAIGGQQSFVLDRGEQVHTLEAAKAIAAAPIAAAPAVEDDEPVFEEELETEDAAEAEDEPEDDEAPPDIMQAEGAPAETGEPGRRRRRRRRRRRDGSEQPYETAPGGEPHAAAHHLAPHDEMAQGHGPDTEEGADAEDVGGHPRPGETSADSERRRRRRGRRGGRRRRGRDGEMVENGQPAEFRGPAEDAPYPAQTEEPHPEPVATAPMPIEPLERPAPFETPQASAPFQPEPPRRRSTVREPVYLDDRSSEAPPARPEPERTEPRPTDPEPAESDAQNKPRRTGWWSRRFAGDKD